MTTKPQGELESELYSLAEYCTGLGRGNTDIDRAVKASLKRIETYANQRVLEAIDRIKAYLSNQLEATSAYDIGHVQSLRNVLKEIQAIRSEIGGKDE